MRGFCAPAAPIPNLDVLDHGATLKPPRYRITRNPDIESAVPADARLATRDPTAATYMPVVMKHKWRTPASELTGATGVDLRGLFSKLAPRLRRALMVVRKVRRRPNGGTARWRRESHQVVQLSERQLAAAEARYAEGAKLRDLAPELGVSRVRLADLLRQRGVRIRNASPTPDEVTEMVRRYESGESLEQIGERLGFNGGTVRNRLVACGVAMRDSHGRAR